MEQKTSVSIKPLSTTDYQAWLPLWQGYQAFYKVEVPIATSEVSWQRMLDPTEPMLGALAYVDGKAVGLVQWVFHRTTWAIENRCYLGDLFVDPLVRGHGIGQQLIEHVYAAAAANNCSMVYWQTHETNSTARQLYNRLAQDSGFVIYKKRLTTT
ncbi:GNAT family N-acetyltransferase [Glaciimonas soli]|uniref:GNAT family N-acetyltransferase n=1 Tax=Glaciimonas soli TaxID=2590999 RepID=A0A843YNV0_9BURK|nr:GNAT family N-acetyltransferase [Glaciimonas soli]MQR00660.1 GNAT family N-acetyltransferase [Glaciimonas soli]